MKIKVIVLLFLGVMNMYSQAKKPVATKKPAATATKKAAVKPQQSADGLFADIQTAKGNILIRLEYKKAPITVANFVSLAEGKNTNLTDEKLKGKPYYDGLKFHRVIKDFMIQGGDPAGNGTGGAGYSFKDEIVPEFVFDKAGILAMANSGPATNSSQFFITHKDTPWLNGKHTIFGYVISGQNVVNEIAQDDIIKKVVIFRKGADAKNFDAAKIFSEYMAVGKVADDKKMSEERAKQAAEKAEAQKKQAAVDAENKRVYNEKFASVMAAKVKENADIRGKATKSATGVESKILKAGNGTVPADGVSVLINYAGYLEDGSMFDSSYEDVVKTYGKLDENRAKANGYAPIPFTIGNKNMIPGFLEGLSGMTIGEKKWVYIPANLAYGAQGAGNVIPPNSNLIFEIEMLEAKK